MMFGSSLPPVVCKRTHVLFTLFVFVFCIVVSSIYCVVFLFCLSSAMLPVSLHNIGYTRQTTLGTQEKQHWVHKTHNIGYTRHQHWVHKTNNIGYTRQTTLGTQDKQHWIHKTNNIGYTRHTTLGTQDKQHRVHKTNNIGYTRHTTLGTQDKQHWVHKTNNRNEIFMKYEYFLQSDRIKNNI